METNTNTPEMSTGKYVEIDDSGRGSMVFFGGNFCFRGNRFSEFLGEMCLGEILGLNILGEIVLGKIFQARKSWGNGSGGNAHKKIPLKSHHKYFFDFIVIL